MAITATRSLSTPPVPADDRGRRRDRGWSIATSRPARAESGNQGAGKPNPCGWQTRLPLGSNFRVLADALGTSGARPLGQDRLRRNRALGLGLLVLRSPPRAVPRARPGAPPSVDRRASRAGGTGLEDRLNLDVRAVLAGQHGQRPSGAQQRALTRRSAPDTGFVLMG